MKDGNNFKAKPRIKFTPLTESAQQDFRNSTACFAAADAARPAMLERFNNRKPHRTAQETEMSESQENNTPPCHHRGTHKLITEEFDDGHTIHTRKVYIPKEDYAPSTPAASMS